MSTIPTWFQTKRQQLLVGIVILLGLPLTTPMWRWTSVACTHDGHLHYHRVAAMRHAWENGLYFSRWLPDLAFGYGYPFFLYREPTPLYLTLFPHLAGMPLPAAGNLFYIICILFGGVFTFLWSRDIFGNRAGIVAAFAYMSAPYVLVDALIRGNQPETIALALFPFLLWSGRRAMLSHRTVWFVTTVLGLAFFSLSHNISLLLFTPFLLVYMLLVGVSDRRPSLTANRLSAIAKIVLIFGLGLGITAFYPGSALLEMDEVTLSLSTTTRNNDFRFNFAPLTEIFAPVTPSDPNLLNPPLPFRLGWMPVLLGLIGAWIGLQRGNREQRIHTIFFVASTALFIFLSTSASFWLWENLPLIDFVQFPWRMVGRAALPLAMLAGVTFVENQVTDEQNNGMTEIKTREQLSFRQSVLPSSLILLPLLLLFIETIPNLYPRICEEEPFPTIQDVFLYEHVTGLVGVDPEGSYFPRTVLQRPSGSALENDYALGIPPQRIDPVTLPAEAQLTDVVYQNNRTSFNIETSVPFQLQYLTFAFPGWQARINGERVEIIPTQPEGLITVDIPAGQHRIDIFFGWTPLRLTLAILSGLALIVFIGIIPFYPTLLSRIQAESSPPTHHAGVPSSDMRSSIIPISVIAIALFFILKFTLFDPALTPIRQPDTPFLSASETLIGAELELVDKQLPIEPVPADQLVTINLGWRANSVPSERYQTALTLIGPDGLRWSEKELYRPRIYEDMPDTVYWQPGQWGWDSWEITPLTGTPPGSYQVELTLFDQKTLQPIQLLDGNRQPIGTTAMLGKIEIAPPTEQPAFSPQYRLEKPLEGTGFELVGYALDREEIDPRERMLVSLYLNKISPETATSIDLRFVSPSGETEARTLDLTGQNSTWESLPPGSMIRTQHFIEVPGDPGASEYELLLDAGTPLPLRTITVRQIERSFEPPLLELPADGRWEDGIELTSYSLIQDLENDLVITLGWKATENIETGYRVFVHGIDSLGNIITQSDGEPASWSRPTTTWIGGEYITDNHRLIVPNDQELASILVGLYDPNTGIRLLESGGRDIFRIDLN